MRRFCFTVVVTAALFLAGVSHAEECTTLGVRDCRQSKQTGVCYWWECQQTGSLKQMIFLGQKCTCPRSELNIGNALLAQLGSHGERTTCGVQLVPPLSE